jgi:hypothetical protein
MGSQRRSISPRTVVRAGTARKGRENAVHVLAVLRRPARRESPLLPRLSSPLSYRPKSVSGTGIRVESGGVLHRATVAAPPVLRTRARFYARGCIATRVLGGHARLPGSRDPTWLSNLCCIARCVLCMHGLLFGIACVINCTIFIYCNRCNRL